MNKEQITIFINDKEYKMPKGITIIQACEKAMIDVPRFCYHERLSIAGNCRMCLVEIEQSPKLVASCAITITGGMKIQTNTVTVKKAREGLLELLLANHPLDCPICDQGGECDLQDQAMVYGSDRGRYKEYKRAVEDKDCGPLIKTVMTRCIHCTRCIRYATEVAGLPILGTTGRGNNMEVGTYINKGFDSEISGNVIDLCPVGALTSKPYAFTARPWELKSTESIDILDRMCSNLRIDVRGAEIMRILPRLNEKINEEWITDKARFAFDSLKKQRITTPLLKTKEGTIKKTNWKELLDILGMNLQNRKKEEWNVSVFLGKYMDLNSLYILKKNQGLFDSIIHEDSIKSTYVDSVGYKRHADTSSASFKEDYTFNSYIQGIDTADFCLMVGIDIKSELPLLNARIRKRFVTNTGFKVFNIGTSLNATYPIKNAGLTIHDFYMFIKGKHPLCKQFMNAKKPIIIIGSDFFKAKEYRLLLDKLQKVIQDIQCFNHSCINYIKKSVGFINHLEVGLNTTDSIKPIKPTVDKNNLIILSEVQNTTEVLSILKQYKKYSNKTNIIIYIGTHGSELAKYADYILPASAYTEKQAYYSNIEGFIQETNIATRPPGDSRENWRIYHVLCSIILHSTHFIESCTNLNHKQIHLSLFNDYNITNMLHNQTSNYHRIKISLFKKQNITHFRTKTSTILTNSISNYYLSDLITENSKIMAQCSTHFINTKKTKWISAS